MSDRPRTMLICHEGADLDRVGLTGWLASFSDLRGVIVIREGRERMRQRIGREVKRIGLVRFLDVLAFRLYYRLFIARHDRAWERRQVETLRRAYRGADTVPELVTVSPNSREAEGFIRDSAADIVIARCKTLLKESVFSLPSRGTFVMHPGICPEYRNAHGCFWALAEDDREHVGMTLLKIDRGIDTGPIYGYYTCEFSERTESHVRIQHRVVLENLEPIKAKLLDIFAGRAVPLDTSGRRSGEWGQPWLTRYVELKRRTTKRARGHLGARR